MNVSVSSRKLDENVKQKLQGQRESPALRDERLETDD
jgi:hypothetical protein